MASGKDFRGTEEGTGGRRRKGPVVDGQTTSRGQRSGCLERDGKEGLRKVESVSGPVWKGTVVDGFLSSLGPPDRVPVEGVLRYGREG